MVLGIGSRKLRKKGSESAADSPPAIRPSPSLPELTAQGIAWPQNLVDVSVIRGDGADANPLGGTRAPRTSFANEDRGSVPFHMPFRQMSNAGQAPPGSEAAPISSIYMSKAPPPSAFKASKSEPQRANTTGAIAPSVRARSIRKARAAPPTFNLMVAGARGSGKTSLLRLFLDTADISPVASPEQRAALEKLFTNKTRHTRSIQTTSVETIESKLDRVLLTVIDTPGLDFRDAHELKLERQVSDIVKYLDTQYADTMGEESKVVRQNKGDQHVHLCIYLIDPSSIIPASTRAAESSFPLRPRSMSTGSRHGRTRSSASIKSVARDGEEGGEEPLTMSPAEIKVLRRLSARVNVLPIIARADSLTDDTLSAVKQAVRKDLRDAGLGFGLFDPPKPAAEETPDILSASTSTAAATDEISRANSTAPVAAGEDDERRSRGVIKLRPNRGASTRSRSRSRSRRPDILDEQDPLIRDLRDAESVANRRFSAQIVAKANLDALMPFAIIAPEDTPRQRTILAEMLKNGARQHSLSPMMNGQLSVDGANGDGLGSNRTSVHMSLDGHGTESMIQSPVSPPMTPHMLHPYPPVWQTETDEQGNRRVSLSFLQGPPLDLKGMFVRKFRWGTVDVLDPAHCDYAALRTAVFSTHMKVLKNHTKEVLYEKYRTEKLLARRATQNFSEAERKRLLSISLGEQTRPVLDLLLNNPLIGDSRPSPVPSRPSTAGGQGQTHSQTNANALKAHPGHPSVYVMARS